jgi:AcrR family transcriptional regulator
MNAFIYHRTVTEEHGVRTKKEGRRQALLDCARRIECSEGVDGINIRRLATEAGIAVGTVYNYFESKQEVLFALTEDFWSGALEEMQDRVSGGRFSDQAGRMISFLRATMHDCAEILMRSLHEDAAEGRARMTSMQRALKKILIKRLEQDEAIRPDVWSEAFTREAFAEFVLANMLSLLRQKDDDAGVFLEVLQRILYLDKKN